MDRITDIKKIVKVHKYMLKNKDKNINEIVKEWNKKKKLNEEEQIVKEFLLEKGYIKESEKNAN